MTTKHTSATPAGVARSRAKETRRERRRQLPNILKSVLSQMPRLSFTATQTYKGVFNA